MTPKFITKDVDKTLYSNYLRKAEECYHASVNSFSLQEWNAAAINAIHACISACDAICIYHLGKRHAGENHNEAVYLFKTIKPDDEEINTNASRLSRILSIKNLAEYEGRLVSKNEAEKLLKDCERFIEYIRRKLPTG